MLKHVCALLVVAACSKSTQGPDCAKAIDKMTSLMPTSAPNEVIDIVKKAAVKSCVDDKWSAEARSCMAKADALKAGEECVDKHLTGEQLRNFKAAMKAAPDAVQPAGGAGDPNADAALDRMAQFKDDMCKCKDSACAQQVSDAMTKWSQEQTAQGTPAAPMSADQAKRAEQIGQDMVSCMKTAMGAP